MSAPFLGDNEDPVDETIFAPLNAVSPEEAVHYEQDDDIVPLTEHTDGSVSVVDELEDNRTRAEKLLDGADVSSDEDNTSDVKRKTNKGAKKLRIVEVKKKTASPDLAEILQLHTKEKTQRAEKKNELCEHRYNRKYDLMEQNLELERKRQTHNEQVQAEEMNLRKRQMKLEEERVEVRKMELQAMLHNPAKPNGRIPMCI